MAQRALTVLHARRMLGRLSPEDAVTRAASLLAEGLDSLPLRQLAALVRPTRGDADPLLDALARAHPAPLLAREDAARIIAEDVARQLIAGAISPFYAAAEIRQLWPETGHADWVTPFVSLSDDHDEHPAERDEIEAEIVANARGLLELHDRNSPSITDRA
jgi:hypothetical protein